MLNKITEPLLDTVASSFYDRILSHSALLEVIQTYSTVERLKTTLKKHILHLFSGQLTEEDVKRMKQIAIRHVQIGLDEKWYIASYQCLYQSLLSLFYDYLSQKEDFYHAQVALSKRMNFEQQIVLHAYQNEYEKRNKEHELKRKEGLLKDIDELVHKLAKLSEESTSLIEEVNAQTREFSSIATTRFEAAASTENEALTGKDEIETQVNLLQTIDIQSDEMKKKMNDLEKASEKINHIVSIVTSIAEQTNLLALNAAIESARAGEFGKGFAVVASEVRKLAEETKQSVSGVSTLIQTIHEQIVSISDNMEYVSTLTRESSYRMNEMKQFFDSILLLINHNKEHSESTKKEMEKFADVIDEVTAYITKMMGTSEQLKQLCKNI